MIKKDNNHVKGYKKIFGRKINFNIKYIYHIIHTNYIC